MSIEKNKTIELIKDFGNSKTDSGSADVQVAILTERNKNLTLCGNNTIDSSHTTPLSLSLI